MAHVALLPLLPLPAHHRVQPHYGVRTTTHKLISFNRLDQWELYDLTKAPEELHNIIGNPGDADTVKHLKAERARVRQELDDRDPFVELAN